MIKTSKTGRVIVRLERLMDEFHRRDDGSESILLADTKFDNHNKMTITGVVQVGTCNHDANPVEDADRIMPRCSYYPSGYIGGGVFEIDIRRGDQVWFHYLCAENRTSIERNRDGTWDVYMQASDIFCLQREGKMYMNQNWVLGEAIKDNTLNLVDMHGYEKAAALTPGTGIEMVKGFALDSYVDEAIILQLDPSRYRSLHREVKESQRVYLAKDAAFPNVIKHKNRLVFKQMDILALWGDRPANVIPVGENHLVKVNIEEYKSTVIHHTVITKAPEWATIISSGEQCKNGKPGDKIMFTRRWTRLLDKEHWLITDGEIQSTLE